MASGRMPEPKAGAHDTERAEAGAHDLGYRAAWPVDNRRQCDRRRLARLLGPGRGLAEREGIEGSPSSRQDTRLAPPSPCRRHGLQGAAACPSAPLPLTSTLPFLSRATGRTTGCTWRATQMSSCSFTSPSTPPASCKAWSSRAQRLQSRYWPGSSECWLAAAGCWTGVAEVELRWVL